MRCALAVGAFLTVLFLSGPGYSQHSCPQGGHWCGPKTQCCPPGEKCAPGGGCTGGIRNGPPCGHGHCRTGFHCVSNEGAGLCAPD